MSPINNNFRFIALPCTAVGSDVEYRAEYSRDYARVLHSPSFRRLEGKTQLFPGQESDFFRNRLTHSLEVSQIAKSIAEKIKAKHPDLDVLPEVCQIAGLIHDIGHPPFGHNGEAALDACMLSLGGFEGNAQTLRVITRLEKKERPVRIIDAKGKDCRVGLNLTARVIASALKYDKQIPIVRSPNASLEKGYYHSEKEIVDTVKACVLGEYETSNFKTIECQIMDIADDIAYSTYDVEDAFKAEFLTPYDIMAADNFIFEQIVAKLAKDRINTTIDACRATLMGVFADVWDEPIKRLKGLDPGSPDFELNTFSTFLTSYNYSKTLARDGFRRTEFTSKLVNSFIICVECPDVPGELHKNLQVLSGSGINLSYMYGYSNGGTARLIMKVSDPAKAIQLLK